MSDKVMVELMLKDVRLKFGKLHEPRSDNGKYTAWLIIDPIVQPDELDKVQAGIAKILREEFKGKVKAGQLDQLCLHKGDNKSHKYPELQGQWYVSASNYKKPLIVDRQRNPLTKPSGLPYDGCYVNAKIELWPQNNDSGLGVNASLLGIQFVRDGEAFGCGGRVADIGDFDVLKDEAAPYVVSSPMPESKFDEGFDL